MTPIARSLAAAALLTLAACASKDEPMPPELACMAGGYEMSDGRVMGLVPRAEDQFRYLFVTGETGPVTRGHDGVWRAETNNVAITLAGCDDGAAAYKDDTISLSGTRIPYRITETRFAGVDGVRAGRLVLPAGGKARAIVVSLHGSERWSGRVSERLQALMPAYGIGVFAYDKRGTGESDGKYTQDFDILAGDAARARVEAVRLYGDADVDVGYWGGSQGGWIGPLAASRNGAAFVIAAYGMAEGPLAEDREETFQNLREAGYGEEVIAQAREITDATGHVMASDFKDGFDELAAVRKKYKGQPWLKAIKGEFTGDFLKAPNFMLRIIGPFFDVGTSWEYEPRPVIESLTMPQLWVLAEDDREAPSANTFAILREIQETKDSLDIVVFPHTDHGIYTFTQNSDGTRELIGNADGYYALLRDFILTREPAVGVAGPIVFRGARGR